MSDEQPIHLVLRIDNNSISEHRLNEMAINLRGELKKLHPVSVELEREAKVPENVMSVGAITAGAIAIAVLPTMMPAIIQYLRDWRLRNANRMITIKRKTGDEEIEVSFPEDMSSERLKELISSVSAVVLDKDNQIKE